MLYHGASTGRWSSVGVNMQNNPRPSFSDTDECIELFPQKDPALINMLYGDVSEALSSCIRGMLKAPPGRKLVVADYSQIEARVLPWLAGQNDVLDVFRSGQDVYKHTAAKIYRKPVEAIDSDERFVGKVAVLALGYQGGAKAFQSMAKVYGVDIDEPRADQIKTDWRKANPKIVQFWFDLEAAAIAAVENPGTTHRVGSVAFRVFRGFLFIRLPSGRLLAYYAPTMAPGRFGNLQVSFMGTNSVSRKWERQTTYGGKLSENIAQAVARDLMALAMIRTTDAGYDIVLSVHDELIAETTDGTIDEFSKLMCELPEWADGLPVAADGFESQRYRK